jgi:hypothetical protein
MFPKRQSGFEIVLVTWFAHEAHIARTLLEADGIEAFVLDAEQIGVQFHVAGAVGGVKVAVRPEDAERARTLLALDHSPALEGVPEAVLPAPDDERCPRCGSSATATVQRTDRVPALAWLSMGVFFLLGVLVPRRHRRVRRWCRGCGAMWVAESR